MRKIIVRDIGPVPAWQLIQGQAPTITDSVALKINPSQGYLAVLVEK